MVLILISQKLLCIITHLFFYIVVLTILITHISTNCMSSYSINLIAAFRHENPSIKITVTSILPRPVDHNVIKKELRSSIIFGKMVWLLLNVHFVPLFSRVKLKDNCLPKKMGYRSKHLLHLTQCRTLKFIT
jgi:ribosomal protein S19